MLMLNSLQGNNFLKSIVAGICVSLGCLCYLSVENRIIGSLLFSVGIISIIIYGLNLYTGKIGLVKSIGDLIDSIIYFFGNMVGSTIIYFLMLSTPIYIKIRVPLENIVADKVAMPYSDLFILGVICGILMLFATKCTKNLIMPILCISVFILIGAEHSVADSFYLLALNDMFMYYKMLAVIALGNACGAIIINRMITETENK